MVYFSSDPTHALSNSALASHTQSKALPRRLSAPPPATHSLAGSSRQGCDTPACIGPEATGDLTQLRGMIAASDVSRSLRRVGTATLATARPAAGRGIGSLSPLLARPASLSSAQGHHQSSLLQQQSPLRAGTAALSGSRIDATSLAPEPCALPSPFPLFNSAHATPPPPPSLRLPELLARRSFIAGTSPATPSSASSLAARPPRTPEGSALPPSSLTRSSHAIATPRSAPLTRCALTPIAADGALRRSSCAAPHLLTPGSGGSTVAAAVAPLFAQRGVGGARMSSGPSGPPAATSHAAFASGPTPATPPAAPRSREDSLLSGARRSASAFGADPSALGSGEASGGGSRGSHSISDAALVGWPGPSPVGELPLPPPPLRTPPIDAALVDADFDSLDPWHSPAAREGGGQQQRQTACEPTSQRAPLPIVYGCPLSSSVMLP